jgi:RNA polymerase sigma-70 factor (ECF subfamily)
MVPEEGDLLRRSRQGDREAFGLLVEEYYPAAMAVAFGCVGNEHDAMDAVQEAFVTAYCRLGQLRDERSFGPWLRTIVRNTAISLTRRRPKWQVTTSGLFEEQTNGWSGFKHEQAGDKADLWEAITALPQKFREPVVLHYFQHWSYERIGWFMGLPTATVKGRLQQARQRLREQLSPTSGEVNAMNSKQAADKVRETLQKIATEEIHQVIPMDGAKNVVIFCGVSSDVELCNTDGNEVVINGTKASIGETAEKAFDSTRAIQLLTDRVDDYVASGPHDGELFCGTNTDKEGNPTAVRRRVSERWCGGKLAGAFSIKHETASPFEGLAKPCPDIESMLHRQMMGVLRVSVLRQSAEDAVLPRDVVTEEIGRLICVNYDGGKVVHGQIGRVSLTIAVPAGCGVTVISSNMSASVMVEHLRGQLALIAPCQCTVKNAEGDVIVVDGLAQEVSGVSGRYIQTFYGIAGGNSSEWQYVRTELPETVHHQTIRDVRGGTHIDGLRLKLECTNLRGQVSIRNCFGTTRFNKRSHQAGDKARLVTDSGKIEIMLKEDLIGQVNITATSIAGPMRYPCLKPLGWVSTRNDMTLMTMSTIDKSGGGVLPPWMTDADIVAHCREGEILIDKMV